MKPLTNSITQFFTAPSSPQPLGFFRIAVAAFALIQALLLGNHLIELYGNYGYIQWILTDAFAQEYMPRLSWFADKLFPFGITPDGTLYLLFGAYIFSLFGLLIGWNTRWMALGAWLIHLTFIKSSSLTTYGVEAFTHIALFYCFLFPTGKSFSIDSWIRGGTSQATPFATTSIRILQLHLCIVYFTGGIGKALGPTWWNGEAIWTALMQPQFMQMDMTWMSEYIFIAQILCWSTLIVEIGYPFFIYYSKTRNFMLVSIVCLHLGIAIFLGLSLFASLMIILNVSAFGGSLVKSFKSTTIQVFKKPNSLSPKGTLAVR